MARRSESEDVAARLRPRLFGSFMRRRWRHGLWFLPLSIVMLAQQSAATAGWIVLGASALGGLGLLLASRNGLWLVDGEILRRTWLGRSARCPRSLVARVVELPIVLTRVGMPETWLLFLDNEGTTLLRAYASYYPPDDLERFHRALDRPWEESDRPIMVAEARRSFPGSFPWPWAHYWLSAVALLVAGFVVAILVTAIVQAST